MYEAPDRYKRLISARLPGGESAGLAARQGESESSPLRDVQLISRAQLAPFFAAANIVAALMMLASLWGSVSPTWLLPWAAAVGAVNLARHAARAHSVDYLRRPLGTTRADLADGRRSRRSRRDLAQPAALPVPVARSGHPGDCRLDHGRPRHRRARPRRRPALRHGVDDRLHLRGRRSRSCSAGTAFRSSICCRSCSRSASRSSASSRSRAGRSTSSRPTPTSAARAKARACCSRNMSSAASAGCGKSTPRTASPTSARG